MPETQPNKLYHAFLEPVTPALKIGTATGITGFLIGGGVGILRSAHPGIVATFTGTQFLVLGSSFLYTREAVLRAAFTQRTTKAELISSTAAGALSGAAAGAFYGRVNSLVGAMFMGTVGHLGQRYVHAQAGAKPTATDNRPYLERLADSNWIPFKSISNSEYEILLTEKLLKVEAEISMIEEKIQTLRQGTNDIDEISGRGQKPG